MKLIIGLGNPTPQYENTRHNAGFIILDEIQKLENAPTFQLNEKFHALLAEKKDPSGEKLLFVKPQSYMNRSGEVVRKVMDFYKVPIENIVVIHDDLDIALGEYKISLDSSAAGHNGVQDIITHVGTQNFKRIRIGIEGSEKKKERIVPGDVFVLQNFTEEEYAAIIALAKNIQQEL